MTTLRMIIRRMPVLGRAYDIYVCKKTLASTEPYSPRWRAAILLLQMYRVKTDGYLREVKE